MMMRRKPLGVSVFVLLAAIAIGEGLFQGGRERPKIASSEKLQLPGAVLQVDFGEGRFDVGNEAVLGYVKNAATAVSTYFGRFPVAQARVVVLSSSDRRGVFQGTTWGDRGGVAALTRIRIGEHTTQAELNDDWMMTHELVHMGFPDVAEDHHWIEEGMATYVEPIARVQAGQLDAKTIWRDMMDGMPKGEPAAGDEGLDRTRTWGRTYWGGALFCLVADVEIRKQTHGRKGLQDALRAVVAAGGNISEDWTVERAFEVGDAATGVRVLATMYQQWSRSPVEVDLPKLWRELGVVRRGQTVELRNDAALVAVREAITKRP